MLLNCGVGEDKSPLDCKEIKLVSPKGNQPWVFIGMTDAEAPILCPSDAKSWLIRKDPDAEKDWRQEKGTTEDEMVGWSHWLYGHEFEQAPGIGDGQGSLAYCSPWGCKELDTTRGKPAIRKRRNLKGIMLSEISQGNTNIVWCHLYGESTKKSNTKKKLEWWLPRAGENGEIF